MRKKIIIKRVVATWLVLLVSSLSIVMLAQDGSKSKVTLKVENMVLSEVLETISNMTSVQFFYNHSLHALEGKLKLIDFWASWCGPCRKENPNMISIYNDFKDKGLLIVGVSLDDNRNAWVKAVEADGLTWLQLSALSGYNDDVVKRYNIDAIPTIYILDASNKIVAKNLRGDKLREFVANYLNNN